MPGKRIVKRTILFIPAQDRGQGTGHIKRCAELAATLAAGKCQVFFLQRNGEAYIRLDSLIREQERIIHTPEQCPEPDLVVMDNRATGLSALTDFPIQIPVIGIDEGGKARGYLPYIIDTLPVLRSFSSPNIFALYRNPYPAEQDSIRYPFRKVLISFGGEDKAGLTTKLLALLLKQGLFAAGALTVIQGAHFHQTDWPDGVEVLVAPPDLAALLPDYDLLFTHFGLTCFEALSAGVPVILVNPSRYHHKLTKRCGLPEAGVGRPSSNKLKKLLAGKDIFTREQGAVQKYFSVHEHNIASLLRSFTVDGSLCCPLCFTAYNRSLARFRDRTFFRCKQCRVIYQARFFPESKPVYGHAYFFDQYKAQYGKTYLEDFEGIKQLSRGRVGVIAQLLSTVKAGTLLDIGCAYGPFLQAYHEAGGIACGIEIAAEAAHYVQETLRFPVLCADFEAGCTVPGILQYFGMNHPFDAVTMWYVIEHFKALHTVLCKVNRLLKCGGVFAFSTPNGTGISARKNRKIFLQQSPPDHYTVLNPALLKRILKHYGFRVQRVRITGHHPERFPGMQTVPEGKFSWKLAAGISRLSALGDTCEVYAKKVRTIEN